MDNEQFPNDYRPPASTSRNTIIGILALSFIIVILIISIVAIITNRLHNTTSTESANYFAVKNYDDLSINIPTQAQESLNSQLYHLLSSHFNLSPSAKTIGTIRPDTVKSLGSSASFIMDIDAYQQSYNIKLAWSDQPDSIPADAVIECATRDQSKYPDVPCFGMYYNSDSPALYLPYNGTLPSGASFSATFSHMDNYQNNYIIVSVQDCGSSSLKDAAVSAVKKYLRTAGNLDSEQFIYQTTSDNSQCINN